MFKIFYPKVFFVKDWWLHFWLTLLFFFGHSSWQSGNAALYTSLAGQESIERCAGPKPWEFRGWSSSGGVAGLRPPPLLTHLLVRTAKLKLDRRSTNTSVLWLLIVDWSPVAHLHHSARVLGLFNDFFWGQREIKYRPS